MLSVPSLKQFCTQVVADIPGINSYVMIVGEEHLRKRLSGKKPEEFPLLVALYPDANGTGQSFDNLQYQNGLDFFILKKVSYSGRTQEQEEDDYTETQELAKEVLKFIDVQKGKPQYCTWLGKVDVNTIAIDPEYNYHGCDGWSFSFGLKTK